MAVKNSHFSGNSSAVSGGGIYNDGPATLTNVTLNSNLAKYGGGIANGGTLTVSNSTFSGNSAGSAGGGIAVNTGTPTLKNTIVANNNGGNCFGVITDGGHNLRWPNTDSSCVGTFGDPNLGSLAHNGGPTSAMALPSGSAAIDAGEDAVCSAAHVTNLDQRGRLRSHAAYAGSGAD